MLVNKGCEKAVQAQQSSALKAVDSNRGTGTWVSETDTRLSRSSSGRPQDFPGGPCRARPGARAPTGADFKGGAASLTLAGVSEGGRIKENSKKHNQHFKSFALFF